MNSTPILKTVFIGSFAWAWLCQSALAAPLGPPDHDLTVFEFRDFQKGHREFDDRDFDAAYRYWLPLARDGVAEAQYNIARMYAYGEGVERDYVISYAWFLRAQDNGADEAADALRQLLEYVSREEISAAETRARQIAKKEAGLIGKPPQPRLFGTGNTAEDAFINQNVGE
jgi:hypothetical protein